MPHAPLFSEAVEDRTVKFLLRLSRDEREFLSEEAARRGIKATTLIRLCLREILCQMPKPKAAASEK